ncbi:hypothetical protein MX659_08780 [Coriobacteriia bacterium Es71-Z0120]|uniref:RHS repeat domain-containing protein n=1 Tax=Parvivirga hydrogeniphila TaxID=2939460 RepID=UPI002260BFD3|nr:RHS repeat-associated core domain-containing protein [Parvivirga hydrogeniphila]MCL4079677.1 hypothetical protein [Parvivirga hydrogeniphila]
MRSYAYTADGRLAFASISGMPDAAYAYEPGTGNLIGIKRGSEPTATLAYEQGSGRIAALLSQGATQTVFSFDSRGRRASQGTPASPQAVRFTYDDADRLVGYSDASRGVSASYAYDAYGQRVRSVVASGSLVTTTTYAYDGLSLLYATTVRSDGTTESVAYLYDAAGAPLAGIYEGSASASPVAFFIATTARGDVAELLDSSGAPFALYSYDAYGNPGQVSTAATARISAPLAEAIAEANALRYAGYAYDAHSGLYCLSKRYYDPATAQFLTKDPAKADGEESPYQYCAGDPAGKVDPSGEWANPWSWSNEKSTRLTLVCGDVVKVGFGIAQFAWAAMHGGSPPDDWGEDYLYKLRVTVRVGFASDVGYTQVSVAWKSLAKLRLSCADIRPRLRITAETYRGRFRGLRGAKVRTVRDVFNRRAVGRSTCLKVPGGDEVSFVHVKLELLVFGGRRWPSERDWNSLHFYRARRLQRAGNLVM